mmetsp:Transcript_26017/g.72581  ORF Transcript_26017/g.72581 Transcript_26017/m.72581 type:complete len:255 (-) Transcript_26017:242-1006(-)
MPLQSRVVKPQSEDSSTTEHRILESHDSNINATSTKIPRPDTSAQHNTTRMISHTRSIDQYTFINLYSHTHFVHATMARTAQPARTTNNNATTTTTTAAAAIDHQDDDATKNTAGASQNDPIVATIDLSNELADRDLPASLSAHIQQSQWAEFIEDAVRHVHRTGIRDRIGQTSVCMTHCLLCFILLSFFLVPFFINLTRPEPPFGGVIPSFYVFLIFPLVVVECAICCGAMYRYAKNKERRQDALDDRINEEL